MRFWGSLRYYLCTILWMVMANGVLAQIDTSFWFAAPAISPGHENAPIVFRFATMQNPAQITITQPANTSFAPYVINIAANSAATVDLTSQINQIESKPQNTVLKYGIKISATESISAYYEVGKSKNPEIFPLKGKTAMGLNFLIPSQTLFGNKTELTPAAQSGFVIVATENNTRVDITPSKADAAGHLAGQAFTITLQKGQTYSVSAAGTTAADHLGGSTLSANKPVCVTIFDDSILLDVHYDLIGDQIVPESNTADEFILIKGSLNTAANPASDYYFIWGIADSTIITIEGVIVDTINRGEYYQGTFTQQSKFIHTSHPVYLLQLTGVENEVAATSLPGINCTGSQQVNFVRSTNEYFQLNLLCKSGQVNGFLLNGIAGLITASMFQDVPGTNGVWKSAVITNVNFGAINSYIQPGSATQITNYLGVFHLGYLNGQAKTGARLGYFSNYGVGKITPILANTVCANGTVQMQTTYTTNTTYSWLGPEGFTSNVYNPSIKNAQPINSGIYKVTANIQGCGIFSDSLSLTVYPTAKAIFNQKMDTICQGNKATLPISLFGKAPWSIIYSDGVANDTIVGITSSLYNLEVYPKNNTVYTLIKVDDGTTCNNGYINNLGVNAFTRVIVNTLPSVSFIGGDTLCLGKSKIVRLSLTGQSPWQMQYLNGVDSINVKNLTIANFPILINSVTATTISILSLTDKNGCAANLTNGYSLKVFEKPQADFKVQNSACAFDTIHFFDVSPTMFQPITSWSWDFGDGNIDSIPNPVKTYTGAGSYTVTLIARNSAGCYGNPVTKTVIVNAKPQSKFTASAVDRFCEQQPIVFAYPTTAKNSGGLLRKLWWNLGNGRIVDTTSADKFVEAYTSSGNYVVRLAIIDTNGCKSDTASQVVQIFPNPKVGFISPVICLSDGIAVFKDTSSIKDHTDSSFQFRWGFTATTAIPVVTAINYPTPATSNLKNPTVTYKQIGRYVVTDTVISNKGCIASKTEQFIVNGVSPNAKFEIAQNANSIFNCSNAPVNIYDSSSLNFGNLTRLEIDWDTANPKTQKDYIYHPAFNQKYVHYYPDFQAKYDSIETKVIKLTAFSGRKCFTSVYKQVSIHASPKVTFNPIVPICNNNESYQITEAKELSGIGGIYRFSGTGVSQNGNIDISKLKAGDIPIKYLFRSNNGCSDSAIQSFKLLESPKVRLDSILYINSGSSFQLSQDGIVNQQPVEYLWKPISYLSNPRISNPMLNIPSPSTKDSIRYQLAVKSEEGCTSEAYTTVFILNSPKIPNAFSPNGDGVNDYWEIKNLQTYKFAQVQVFDRNGMIVFLSEGQYQPWDGTFGRKPLPVGTYYYIVRTQKESPSISGSVTIIR